MSDISRRRILKQAGTAALAATLPLPKLLASGPQGSGQGGAKPPKIADPDIRAGLDAAVNKNLLAAATEIWYPGHFTISADGGAYGNANTWPGLDSWQMAGAYLLLGRTRLVTDYFDFVRASQRSDGNIPFAIFTGNTQPGTEYLRGLKTPKDRFTYAPPNRDGVPASSQETRQWVGLFRHWELKSNPLSVLAPICYLLTAAEIHDTVKDLPWLRARLPSIEAAATYLVSRISANGLMSGSGFYTELPPRWGWDGVTQCYAYHAFRELSKILHKAGKREDGSRWSRHADHLKVSFVEQFWRTDHFGEYVHFERGLVDLHGLSDTNWAAVAFGLTEGRALDVLWPRLVEAKEFWWGDMPTLTVTKPFSYEAWENEPVPFPTSSSTSDVAAMGRSWYLEALACRRMGAHGRLVAAARRVSRMATDGYWRERYHPKPDGTVEPAGAEKYCEYAAILARVVLGNHEHF